MSAEMRQAIVTEALSWLGTPFHHSARIKGVGVDCAMLLAEVFERVGMVAHVDVANYPFDWHMHQKEQRFSAMVTHYAHPISVDRVLPGDVVLFQFGQCASHGAIVIAWPSIVHAWMPAGRVVRGNALDGRLANRIYGTYSAF